MHVVQQGGLLVVLAALLAAGAAAPAAAADATDGAWPAETTRTDGGDAVPQTEQPTLNVTQSFALTPDRPGTVRVTRTFTLPGGVRTLNTTLPADAEVTATAGFQRETDRLYRWDESTETAWITYRLPVNRTVQRTGPEAAEGRYLYADTGAWALFRRPSVRANFTHTGVGYRRSTATAGPGASGEWLVYLGDTTTVTRTASGQRFRLVVPAAANLTETPEAILASLASASDALRVGDRDDRVTVIAAPTAGVEWGVRGLAVGDADAWVRADERLDVADNVWLHEYVHTRQAVRLQRETLWLNEATASYYAALLTLEQDRIDFAAFRRRLQRGERAVYDEVVLSNVSTWTENPQYHRGALVAGRLDLRIRRATDSRATFQSVLQAMNGRDGTLSQVAFLGIVAETGGADTLAAAQRYTGTATTAAMWNRTTHAAVFGQLPARIGYELPAITDPSGYRVNGTYRRNRSVAGSEPIVLVTGEQLVVNSTVRNAGGTAGQFNVTLSINDTVVDRASGTIGPTERRTVPLAHRFLTPGRYAVSVDGENVTVSVRRPARAVVTDLTVAPTHVQQSDAVTAEATVTNDADIPAETTVVFTRDFQAAQRVVVRVPPSSSVTRSVTIRMTEAGSVTIGAGRAPPVAVEVEPVQVRTGGDSGPARTARSTSTATATRAPPAPSRTTTAAGPGFGASALLAALALVALAGRRDGED